MSDLYNDDILLWSERQAELLRRLAAGERANDLVDWENVIEEVESVGSSNCTRLSRSSCRRLSTRSRAEGWPNSRDAPNWRAEAVRFRCDAADRYAPSMRQRIDLAGLYRRALRTLPETRDGQHPLPVRQDCQTTLDELLAEP
jgi:Domain of unknown function DUF29